LPERGDRRHPRAVHHHRAGVDLVRCGAVRPPQHRRGHLGAAVRPVRPDLRLLPDHDGHRAAPGQQDRGLGHEDPGLSRHLIGVTVRPGYAADTQYLYLRATASTRIKPTPNKIWWAIMTYPSPPGRSMPDQNASPPRDAG